jgi:1-acyl-sn-glycerol-3-phosphate acyltransferase
MVKGEFFWGPLGWLLRKLGAVPVDRKKGGNAALSVIREMKATPRIHLALAPEGTRKPVKRWKTGFHTIARQVGCPVYMGYFDWGTKRISRGHKIELTNDPKADMARIQALYEEMHLVGKHPEMYITH